MTTPITFRADPNRPCPVCLSPSKGCSATADGLHLCRGEPADAATWRKIPPSPDPLGFNHYRNNATDPVKPKRPRPRRASSPAPTGGTAEPDWEAAAERYAAAMRPADRQWLADRLGVPVEALDLFGGLGASGSNSAGPTITFPEYDGAGKVIGLSERVPGPEGRDVKRQLPGGRRGLTLAEHWSLPDGPVYVVEGPSDTIAMAAAGLAAVGRPGSAAGGDLLVRLLRDLPAGREIVVVGENDRKENGDWPGRDGCLMVAAKLAADLKRPVRAALPPVPAKDVRAWLTDPVRASVSWQHRSMELASWLGSTASTPPPTPTLNGHAAAYPLSALLGGAKRAEIVVGVDEHRVNDQAVAALAHHPDTFRRSGSLVYVAWEPPADAHLGDSTVHYPAGPRIVLMSLATLRERLTEVADWKETRQDANGGTMKVQVHPPKWCPPAVLDRKRLPGLRPLHALADYPCFVGKGKILSAPGYDPATAIYYSPAAAVDLTVPDEPSRADVAAALETLAEVVVDFPFLHPRHRSAWLAGVLTPLARFAFRGPSPLFLVEANVPGAGKGLLVEAAHLIVRGEEAAGLDFPRKAEELDKVVTSLLVRGETTASFDNVEGTLGGAVLNRLLTASMWEGRILSTSTTVRAPNLCTWWATGNNVAVVGDTARRVCPIRLESRLENPEERDDLHHANLKAWVRENRPRLLSAALTLLRGYHVAGRPDQKLRQWGSYESWSALIRGTIVWAGWPDPYQAREGLKQAGDSRIQAMRVLLCQWDQLDANKNELTCREIIEIVEQDKPRAALADLIEAVATLSPPSKPDRAGALGYALRSFYHRVIDGKMLTYAASHAGMRRWEVRAVDDPLYDELLNGDDGGHGGDIFGANTHARTRPRTPARGDDPPLGSSPSTPSSPSARAPDREPGDDPLDLAGEL